MKMVTLILLMLCLLQPLACFTHPCASCLGDSDSVETSGASGSHSHNPDADQCDSTTCCAEFMAPSSDPLLVYAPIVSAITVPERSHDLPAVVMPIFIPPQNLA
jgi:hypothetical protein